MKIDEHVMMYTAAKRTATRAVTGRWWCTCGKWAFLAAAPGSSHAQRREEAAVSHAAHVAP